MTSTNTIDQDQQIAAASLLALVGSVPKPPEVTISACEVKVTTKRKPQGDDGGEQGPPPKRIMTQENSGFFCDDSPKKVSDDESSQRNLRRSSTVSTIDGEVMKVSRRHSCPVGVVAPMSKADCVTKKIKSHQVPMVLMHLLTDEDRQREHMNTMFFLPDNSYFVIRNNNEFSQFIMPKYFQMTKFGCFIKKLERWGFTHTLINKKGDQHLFHHPFFSRNKWDLLQNVQYTPMRGEAAQKNKKSSTSGTSTTTTRTPSIAHKKDSRRMSESACSTDTKASLQSSIHRELILSRQLETGLAALNKIRDLASPSLSASCSSLMPRVSPAVPNSICFQSQTAMNNATKDIVAKAIDCLLHDEEHTRDLLARRGDELRQAKRLSLPNLYKASKFGNTSVDSMTDIAFH